MADSNDKGRVVERLTQQLDGKDAQIERLQKQIDDMKHVVDIGRDAWAIPNHVGRADPWPALAIPRLQIQVMICGARSTLYQLELVMREQGHGFGMHVDGAEVVIRGLSWSRRDAPQYASPITTRDLPARIWAESAHYAAHLGLPLWVVGDHVRFDTSFEPWSIVRPVSSCH